MSTVEVERGFSLMNLIKSDVRNRILDDLLEACMLIYLHDPGYEFLSDEFLNNVISRWLAMKNRLFVK